METGTDTATATASSTATAMNRKSPKPMNTPPQPSAALERESEDDRYPVMEMPGKQTTGGSRRTRRKSPMDAVNRQARRDGSPATGSRRTRRDGSMSHGSRRAKAGVPAAGSRRAKTSVPAAGSRRAKTSVPAAGSRRAPARSEPTGLSNKTKIIFGVALAVALILAALGVKKIESASALKETLRQKEVYRQQMKQAFDNAMALRAEAADDYANGEFSIAFAKVDKAYTLAQDNRIAFTSDQLDDLVEFRDTCESALKNYLRAREWANCTIKSYPDAMHNFNLLLKKESILADAVLLREIRKLKGALIIRYAKNIVKHSILREKTINDLNRIKAKYAADLDAETMAELDALIADL